MPLLEVVTRCYKRPAMLAVNQASLDKQTSAAWEQTLLHDYVGRGIGWSYTNMAAYAPHLTGDYVWILDDDDECVRETLVEELAAIALESAPDVIFMRMDHGMPLGILPRRNWGGSPALGDIGVSAFVVRREVWQRYANHFGAHYAGDYSFIAAVYAGTQWHVWHDVVASRVQRVSRGAPE